MSFRESVFTLSDGRDFEWSAIGDPTGRPVFYHHGTPGSSRFVTLYEEVATRGDLFIVSSSRPGYGRSSRDEGRTAASVVADVRELLDHLKVGEYATLGWSGGGPHALACAALDPRCTGAVVLAGVAPSDVDFDWTEGMGPENIEEFRLAQAGGPEYEAYLAMVGEVLAAASADNVVELFGGLLSEADKAVLDDEAMRAEFAAALAHGLAGGWRGFYDDDHVFMTPWGFDVGDVATPVALFFGDQDLMVPPTHGRWLGSRLPHATTHYHEGEGHVSILPNHLDEVVAALVELS